MTKGKRKFISRSGSNDEGRGDGAFDRFLVLTNQWQLNSYLVEVSARENELFYQNQGPWI